VYPPADEIFTAFELTPLSEVKVVILGQDPYHEEGQAHGLSFSVRRGVQIPPSLRNIYQEIYDRRKMFAMIGNHIDSALAVCNIGTGNMNGMGQSKNIHNDVQLDARYLLTCIISLFLSGIGILYALCIYYAERCLFISLVLLTGISH